MNINLRTLFFKLALIFYVFYPACNAYILNSNIENTNYHSHHRSHHHKAYHTNGNNIKSSVNAIVNPPERNTAQTNDLSINEITDILPNRAINDFFLTDGDSDPCLVHYCPKGRECEVNPNTKLPECICQRSCDGENAPTDSDPKNNNNRPICGSDGMVYENHCELHRAACILNRPIAFQRLEKCTTSVQQTASLKKKEKKKIRKFDAKTGVETTTTTFPFPSTTDADQFHLDDNDKKDYMFIEQTSEKVEQPVDRLSKLCSSQEYEIMKDNLLLFSHARLMTQDNNHSKDFLVSIMFSHYDQNNNGHLDAEELNQVSQNEQLEELSNGCVLRDMLQYDDLDKDQCLNINEFYQAFNKLYSKWPTYIFYSCQLRRKYFANITQ